MKSSCRLSALYVSALAVGLSTLLSAAHADGFYSIMDLGTLSNDPLSRGLGISPLGQVTGYSGNVNGPNQVFRSSIVGNSISSLGTLGGTDGRGVSINATGQIAGYSTTIVGNNNIIHAFRSSANGDPAALTDLGTLGGNTSNGMGINAAGQVAGYSQTATTTHAFRTSASGLVSDGNADLGALPGGLDFSEGNAINTRGEVTGLGYINSNFHAFRSSATGSALLLTDLGTLPGSADSFGQGINDNGQVTGYSDVSGLGQRAFRTTATGSAIVLTNLGVLPGGTNSRANGINSAGQVVGYSDNGTAAGTAFLYTDGIGMQDLNSLLSTADKANWSLEEAQGINDGGQITGFGIIGNAQHAFRLTPNAAVAAATPEPGTMALFLSVAVAGAGFLRRRRRA